MQTNSKMLKFSSDYRRSLWLLDFSKAPNEQKKEEWLEDLGAALKKIHSSDGDTLVLKRASGRVQRGDVADDLLAKQVVLDNKGVQVPLYEKLGKKLLLKIFQPIGNIKSDDIVALYFDDYKGRPSIKSPIESIYQIRDFDERLELMDINYQGFQVFLNALKSAAPKIFAQLVDHGIFEPEKVTVGDRDFLKYSTIKKKINELKATSSFSSREAHRDNDDGKPRKPMKP